MSSELDEPACPEVLITRSALEAIVNESARRTDNIETGGILLGWAAHSRHPISIRWAGGPGPNALHEARRFLRDREFAQQLADEAWNNDRSVWLGEWHTHPYGGHAPSGLDLQSYLQHLSDPDLGFDVFLSLIALPLEDHSLAVITWLITRSTLTAAQLTIAPENTSNDDTDV